MLVLFNHGTPKGLARLLAGHTIHTAQSRAGTRSATASVDTSFEVLLTTDRRIRYQQNLEARRIALVVLTGSTKWSHVRQHASRIAAAVATSTTGSYEEVEIPSEARSAPL